MTSGPFRAGTKGFGHTTPFRINPVAPLDAAPVGAARRPYLSKCACPNDISCSMVPQMNLPHRKYLPHEIPLWVDPSKEVYFITINCQPRGLNQLALPDVAERLFETVRYRQANFLWWPYVFLLMPDHLHALLSFPPSDEQIQMVIRKWKEWTAKTIGIQWQRSFFEHRLRHDESRRQKADYILENPVRKQLVSQAKGWPHIYFGDGERHGFPD